MKVKYKAFLQPVQEDPTAPNVEINTSDFLSESDGSNEEVKPIDAVLAGKFNGIGGNADITLQKELKAEESTDMAPVKQKDDGEG